MNRLVLLDETVRALEEHLTAAAPREEGAFLLLRSGQGHAGTRLIVSELLLPPPAAWDAQERDQLRPTTQWLSVAVSRAIAANAGLLFVHSHPGSNYPPGFSAADDRAFTEMARAIGPLLDGPLAATVVHPTGWSGVVWHGDRMAPIDRIQALGRTLRFLNPLPALDDSALDARQRDALGVIHDRLRHLSVAVVGCGGVGSPLAEQLRRMGAGELMIVDHDALDTPSNVRRVFGSSAVDLAATTPPAKVDVVGRHLDRLGLGGPVRRIAGDVRTEPIFRQLLDADVVFAATDTHGSRAALNDLPSAYFLPVIDIGTRVGAKLDGALSGLFAEVRILTPTTPCLWCRGTIDGEVIAAENLPEDDRRERVREGYVIGETGEPEPSVVALTVLGSGLAACGLLALLAEEGDVAPTGYVVDGFMGDARESAAFEPVISCRCREILGLGDAAALAFATTGLPGKEV
jgi:molybdopterin/thiamine biosynthesis adenylyltransferase